MHGELIHGEIAEKVLGAAIEVHKHLGPGLLESAYEACLCHELAIREVAFRRQVRLPLDYKGLLPNFNVPIMKDGIVRRVL